MKSIRVLLAVSIFALFAGIASANCGSCEKKETCDKAEAKAACAKDCDKPCCKKECSEADKAKCEVAKMSCCEEAAKAGKTCEKCSPPAKK